MIAPRGHDRKTAAEQQHSRLEFANKVKAFLFRTKPEYERLPCNRYKGGWVVRDQYRLIARGGNDSYTPLPGLLRHSATSSLRHFFLLHTRDA